jgi:tRNA pseudouridine55 synthase
MGHGGTLDPLATGVLIVAIGRGTKTLGTFLGGTKTYETVVLFGKSTDTYDIAGKVVDSAPHEQIPRTLVEEKMERFKGKIKQVPPIYSALKINGMKAYDYARTGKPLPRELESRDMTVDECSLLDWYEGGKHDFRWPVAEASASDREAARRLMRIETQTVSYEPGSSKTEAFSQVNDAISTHDTSESVKASEKSEITINTLTPADKATQHTHDIPELSDTPADAPAARIRLTSSSGFYVRSFAHDLGIACSSYGTMAELTRTRQSGYTIHDPPPEGQTSCLTYDDIEAGEAVWGPKIMRTLEAWMEKNPAITNADRPDDRDRPYRYRGRGNGGGQRYYSDRRQQNKRKWAGGQGRRNSSSDDN